MMKSLGLKEGVLFKGEGGKYFRMLNPHKSYKKGKELVKKLEEINKFSVNESEELAKKSGLYNFVSGILNDRHAISYSRATADAKSGKIYIRVPYVGDKEKVDIPPYFREPEGGEYKIFIS